MSCSFILRVLEAGLSVLKAILGVLCFGSGFGRLVLWGPFNAPSVGVEAIVLGCAKSA